MNATNYHSHCDYCDGRAPLEEFVKEAIAQGFTSYGISSHAPLPFPTAWTLESEKVDAYLNEAYSLKAKYADRIELYVGMEIDYLNGISHPANDYFRSLNLEYRIGSVHLLYSPAGEVVDVDTTPEKFQELTNLHFGGDLKQVVIDYYTKLMRMVELGGFDFVGHADKISCNAHNCQPGILEKQWYLDLIRSYFEAIAKRGLMVEINTKALERYGMFFPNASHFPLLKELDVDLLVNSDAHYPNKINDGRPQALCQLKEAGIDTVMELHGGKWQKVEIGR